MAKRSAKTSGGKIEAKATGGASLPVLVAAALLSVSAGFGGVYATLGRADNAERGAERPIAATAPAAVVAQAQSGATPSAVTPAPQPAAALPTGPGANPLSSGQMAGFVFKSPADLPEIAYVDGTGKAMSAKDWEGRVILLNLWATWCAPCRKEMPALDRLQAEMGSDKFEVVALSVDRGGIEASKKFLDQVKVEKLKVYVDSSARASSTLKAVGLPTTLLIKNGREIGRLVGPAEWDSPEAKRLIMAALQ